MPFTFSHPAIVLPLTLNKKYFSASGLILGSMIPDFEYFIRMRISAEYGHNLSGVLWFDLPLSLVLLFIFHNIVRNDLINNLPYFFKIRFIKFQDFAWNSRFKNDWLKIISSIILGTLSHLLWDSFTHNGGYFVESLPWLKEHIDILIARIPIYNILQHLSTVIGGVFILFFIYKMPKNQLKNHDSIRFSYWGTIIFLTTIILILRFKDGIDFKFYGNIVASLISGFLVSLIITSITINSKTTTTK